MANFSSIFTDVYNYFNPNWSEQIKASVEEFKTFLNTDSVPKIRIYVSETNEGGQQDSTIAIVYQLANSDTLKGLGYEGIIDIFYEGGAETLARILSLLPEEEAGKRTIGKATINIISLTDNPPTNSVTLGFTGGGDDVWEDNTIKEVVNYAKKVKTDYLLRLQPYKWSLGQNQIQFNSDEDPITLTERKELGYSSFAQRAFYLKLPIDTPTIDTDSSQKEQICNWVVNDMAEQTNFVSVDGIANVSKSLFKSPAEDRMFEVIVSMLSSQRDGSGTPANDAKPIIVLSLGEFENQGDQLKSLIEGGLAKHDSFVSNEAQVLANRQRYLETIQASDRVEILWNPTLTELQKVTTDWLLLANDRVLFVQIGEIEKALYNFMLQQTILPPVFESQSTANDMINMGKYYLQPASQTIQYPSTVLGIDKYNTKGSPTVIETPAIPVQLQEIANNLNFELNKWPAEFTDAPTEILGTYIQNYIAETDDTKDEREYFKNVGEFYQNVDNDKFRYGVGFFKYILQGKGVITKPGDADLTKLLASLEANRNTTTEELKLYPGAISSGVIYDFFFNLFGVQVLLEKSTISPTPATGDPTEIKVTGEVTFKGALMALEIKYTAPDKVLVSETKLTYKEAWTPEELPWFRFSSPFIEFKIVDSKTLTFGSVGGRVDSAEVDLAIQLPIKDGKWQLSGSFDSPLTLSTFFQMVGGINLTQSLPAPFDAAYDFGPVNFQLVYDSINKRIDYAGVTMATGKAYELMPGLNMDSITANVTVQNPAVIEKRKTNWNVQGIFKIGNENPGIIEVGLSGPSIIFNGKLASGEIKVVDLFNMFLNEIDLVLPDSSPIPTVTSFEFNSNQETKSYFVSCALNTYWPFSIAGKTLFTVTGLGVSVSGDQPEEGEAVLVGGLEGQVILMPNEPNIALQFTLSAEYNSAKKVWNFVGEQTGGELSLSGLVKEYLGWDTGTNIGIDGLGVNIETGDNAPWEIRGKTAKPWEIPFPVSELSITGDMKLGSNEELGDYGEISADIEWNGIDLKLFYNYNDKVDSYGFLWKNLKGEITVTPEETVGTLSFTESTTIGSIIEDMISWATGTPYGLSSPWNFLDKIPLNGLELEYNFTKEIVHFNLDIGPIDMVFAKIEKISVSYNSNQPDPKDNGVHVSLIGKFMWDTDQKTMTEDGSEKLTWNAAKPEDTPTPSGQGNDYFDLRLLALGQHVTLPAFADAKTVQDAVAAMVSLPGTKSGELPAVEYDENSSWLIGMDFGVLKIKKKDDKENGGNETSVLAEGDDSDAAQYFITLQTIFNDPNLYALRIALEGDMAKVFAGLDFQIMYRKISDSVGVYSAEITLPDVMRKIKMGQFNITLPVFAIEVYTNGDFQVDIGFPWNSDFSRSLTFQAIIIVPPGIPLPVMGSVGIYFGKLSSATTDKVPKSDLGTFNPVLVFGFGFQVGLGYDFSAGILKAGFSLTAVAILEGVIATWNPYQLQSSSQANQSEIEKSYFFWFKGTVGIIGKLYGSIDFAIIKADVNVEIKILASLTIAPYEDILIELMASIEVSVSVKINLGLFKISISFSFSASIHQTITIAAPAGTAPWVGNAPSAEAILPQGFVTLLAKRSRIGNCKVLLIDKNPTLNWNNLIAATTKEALTGYVGLGLTAAQGTATTLADQVPCYVAMLFIDSMAPPTGDVSDSVSSILSATPDTPFEMLSMQVLRWVIAATQSSPQSAEDIDNLIVTKLDLQNLYDALSGEDKPTPIPVDAIEQFLSEQFEMTFSSPTEKGEANATFFPMAIDMELDIPDYGEVDKEGKKVNEENEYKGCKYTFDSYNSLSEDYLEYIRNYFNELAVQINIEEEDNSLRKSQVKNDVTSMADFVFGDYFLLIARQMIQSSIDALRDFKYLIDVKQTVQDIVTWVNDNSNQNGSHPYSVTELFIDNPDHILNKDRSITINGALYSIQSGDTFDSIAKSSAFDNKFTGAELATANALTKDILVAGSKITYQGKIYIVEPGDSLQKVATALETDVQKLVDDGQIESLAGLLVPVGMMVIPSFVAQTGTGQSLTSFAAQFNVTLTDLGKTSANANITDLFEITDNPYLDIADLSEFKVSELLLEIQRSLGIQHLSGMASRYYLAGMRLPTKDITPLNKGMWVTGEEGNYKLPDFAGLYALTGQQFPAPLINDTAAFKINFNRGENTSWYSFTGGTSTPSSLQISIADKSKDAIRLNSVATFAKGNILDTGLTSFGPQRLFKEENGTYPLTTDIVWESASPINLPYGDDPVGVPSINIWMLQSNLLNLPDLSKRAINPTFEVKIGQYSPATRTMINRPVESYAWASVIDLTIKTVPEIDESPSTKTTYEIVGANNDSIVLLEQLLSQLGEDSGSIDSINLAYDRSSNSTSETSGLQTDPYKDITMGIAQSNLSTETKPGGGADVFSLLTADYVLEEDQVETMTLLNEPIDFLKLIWQASITRSGGYFLYYFNEDAKIGLPSRLFNDKGEASLSIVVMYKKPDLEIEQNNLTSYMNAFISGDAIDPATSQIFAEANPTARPVNTKAGDTLQKLAYAYYGNVSDVANDNGNINLSDTFIINITEGTYEVGGKGSKPGGDITAIKNYFGIANEKDIKDANPLITEAEWEAGLPVYTAIYLPKVSVQIKDCKGGTTLRQIANYYGQNLTSLASHNQETPDIFNVGTSLNIIGGPKVISATVPPGVVSMEASRPVPADPDTVSDEEFGKVYLLNMYGNLAYQIAPNPYFNGSKLSLPVGPTKNGSNKTSDDKVRVPEASQQGDSWDFQQAIPYSALSKQVTKDQDGMPPASKSPYLGLGTMIQASYAWQDIFGNRLMTDLSDPTVGPFLNEPPILTGYTDAIIGLNQWQSIAAAWHVVPNEGADPQLLLNMSFDPTTYQGMVKAIATSATEVTVSFSNAIEQTSAELLTNYSLNGDVDQKNISEAVLQPDGRTVLLTVSDLLETNSLSIQLIQTVADGPTYAGEAQFGFPDQTSTDPILPDSTVMQNARQALQLYTNLWYQLNDINGIEYSLCTSFLKDKLVLEQSQVTALVECWISSIYKFVKDVSEGKINDDKAPNGDPIKVKIPEPNHVLYFNTKVADILDEEIIKLTVDFNIERTGGAISGDFETTGSIKKSTVTVTPLTKKIPESNTLDSSAFADSFEAAFIDPDVFQMRVSTGEDRTVASNAAGSNQLWAVRMGLDATEGISYEINNPDEPQIFAPSPISNKLETRTHIPIYNYTTGSAIDFSTVSTYLDFNGIDMDKWVKQFFNAFDNVLTPKYMAAIQLVDNYNEENTVKTAFFESILTSKRHLAEIAKTLMIPVYEGATWDPTEAQNTFKQNLLVELSNAYTTKAAIGFNANVQSSSTAKIAPRLYGNIIENLIFIGATTTETPNEISLFFSALLVTEQAELKTNYTVDKLTVVSASLMDNNTQVILTLDGSPTIGETKVEVAPTFKNRDGKLLLEPYVQTVEKTISRTNVSTSISMSSPKLNIEQSTDEPITFLINSPEIVKATDGAILPYVSLNLLYEAANIEHQIGTLTGDEVSDDDDDDDDDVYQASTWLSFLKSGSIKDLSAQLGGFDVPMFLRNFPTPPSMANQLGVATYPVPVGPLTNAQLNEVLQWNYSFTYSEVIHYPQDQIDGIIKFNLKESGILMRSEFTDAFAELAEFITVFPSINKDLNEILATIDSETKDKSTAEKTFENATYALESYKEIVQRIVKAANESSNGLVMQRNSMDTLVSDTKPFEFTIKESNEVIDSVDALIITIIAAKVEGIGIPKMIIEGYESELMNSEDKDTYKYYFKSKDGVLSALIGQQIPDRTMMIPELNILQRQDASTTVEMTRNLELVPNKTSAKPFVYTTGEVGFTNIFRPTSNVDTEIDMSLLGGTMPSTLNDLLTQFFSELLMNNSQDTLSFQMSSKYEYSISSQMANIELPILIQPLVDVNIKTGIGSGSQDLSTMISNWSTGVMKFFESNYPVQPDKATDILSFDITIFSNLTDTPMPLVRLTNVMVSMKNVLKTK